MEEWFRQTFEDPAQRTPYESAEGGYIWIWGGPYDARNELESEFHGLVPQEVINKLVDKLEEECIEWAPTESEGEYDEELFEAVYENREAQKTLEEALGTIQSLLNSVVQEPLAIAQRRLLFANVITALETFLSDTFINRVLPDDVLLQKYLDAEKAFQERKFTLNNAIKMASQIKDIARRELLAMVWHKLDKVKSLYAEALSIDLGDIGPIASAVAIRHDIVHRNGRKREGGTHVIEAKHITDLIQLVEFLAIRVDQALNPQPVVDPDDSGLPF